jgi:hypothetical protein
MAKVMMTVRWQAGAPTIGDIKQRFSLTDKEIDSTFGVVEVDPDEHIFTFLVEENSASKVKSGVDISVEGPFSNPRIEPFGPPESS